MNRKYAVAIFDRHYLGDQFFAFNCDRTEIGTIDEETDIFTDRNGREFLPITDPALLTSEVPIAYGNAIPLTELKKIIGENYTIGEAVKEYDNQCKNQIIIVAMLPGEKPLAITFDKENLRDTALSHVPKQEEETMDPTIDDKDYGNPFQNIIAGVISGQYSLKELKSMLQNLKTNDEDLQDVIEAIELQIEASEKGESSIELPKDPEEEPEEEKQEEPQEEPQEELSEEEAIIQLEEFKKQRRKQNLHREIDIDDLYQKVIRTLIAQDVPARRVIAELARKEMNSKKKKRGILLTGPTGVGKTELMRLIAKYLKKPFIKVNSTDLTIPGYVGKDIEEVLWDLYVQSGKSKEKAEKAIIFFDEIDKKGSDKKSDVSGQGVLNVLLPFIEGGEYDACADVKLSKEKVKINTSNMTVILGGAFTDVYKSLKLNNDIGFGGVVSTKPRYRKATTQDFVERGMVTDEFMSRVTVVRLNDLDVEDIKRVMLESDESAMLIQQQIFEELGVKITFTDGFVDRVAEKAYQKRTGARGLDDVIDESTWKAFDIAYCNPDEYEEVIFDEESVLNPDHFQLVKRKGNLY